MTNSIFFSTLYLQNLFFRDILHLNVQWFLKFAFKMKTLVCTFYWFFNYFLYQVLEDCKWFHVWKIVFSCYNDSLQQINFWKKCFASFAFLKLKVCSVHYLTLNSLAMAMWPPVNCSYIFLSKQIKLNQSCIARAMLSDFSANSKYNVKRHSKIAHWKNIWKEIDKAMEWFQWLTWLFHLVVALFFIIFILFSL